MKIRWREHEMVLVTMIGAYCTGHLFMAIIRPGLSSFEAIYAAPFEARHFPFNLFRNVLVPDLGLGCSFIFPTYG